MNSKIAIIPARGGSKRLPHKNILDIGGKPMIAWAITEAIASNIFDTVLVSTDDPEIAEISKSYGADVPFLRNSAYDDITPVSVATLTALNQAQEFYGKSFDVVVQLMANCPLRRKETIAGALESFESHHAEFQISCFSYGWMNPWWAVKLDEKLHPSPLYPQALKTRSQDLEKLYCPTGSVWIAKSSSLKETKTFYGPGHIFYPIDWMDALDIDDADDLTMARACFFARQIK